MNNNRPKLKTLGIVVPLLFIAVWLTSFVFHGRPARVTTAQTPDSTNLGPPAQSAQLPPSNAQTPTLPGTNTAAASPSILLEQARLALAQSGYGTNRIEDLLRVLTETPGGREIQLVFQALALRKQEALPIISARLKTGQMWEKHMLAKFLRLCPWPETKDELLALARSETEHWLPRQDAVFTLGAFGDPSVGSDIVAVLNSHAANVNLRMAAVSTLSRVGYSGAAAAISPFAQSENIHLRLFATRALAELGETVDSGFLLSSLANEDYVVRQEASDALWRVAGQDAGDALRKMARTDPHEAVRDAASQALLRRDLAGRNPAEKADILRRSLNDAERLTALWILRTALDEAGTEGRSFVQTIAVRDDSLGERSRAYLIFADSRTR